MTKTDDRIDEIIARKMAQTSGERFNQMDELEWLHYQREQTRKELKASGKRIKRNYQQLTPFAGKPTSRWGKAFFVMDKGVTMLRGLRVGLRIGDAIRLAMSVHKLFRRRK